ncbi:MAG: FecR family protein [Treponema sp.]|nr:FecR family protein [Treponema sp.]MCL2237296.1 FecR family protein [Treponema sp.]
MKKTFFAIFLFSLTFFVFGQSGVIRSMSGQIELKHPGSSGYIAANVGDVVSEDTEVYAGLRSNAVIAVGSAVISVRPLTRLTLRQIRASAQEEQVDVNLRSGRVRVEVNPPAGTRTTMSVTSPSATASVRGTTFEFDTRVLRVEHGAVSFQGTRGYAVTVNAGAASTVTSNGAAAPPATVSESQAPPPPVGADTSSRPTADSHAVTSGVDRVNFPVNVDYPD